MGRDAREAVGEGGRLYAAALVVCGDHGRAVEAVQEALKRLQDEAVARELDAIPVARLQRVTEGRRNWTPSSSQKQTGQVCEDVGQAVSLCVGVRRPSEVRRRG